MANPHVISTPRGSIVHITTKEGDVKAVLKWNPGFGQAYTNKFGRVQVFIDNGVIKGIEPYTPLRTSMMIKSLFLGSVIGSGLIRYLAPYAKRQYYMGRVADTSSTGELRGRLWFARWKAEKGDSFKASVRAYQRSQQNG
jgi:hypothetical protein